MIDLHFHTIFSDGDFVEEDVISRVKNAKLISITDHNSVNMYLSLLKEDNCVLPLRKRFLIGTELTAEGYPDCLLYYPKVSITDKDELEQIEAMLMSVREKEHEAVKKAYEVLKQGDTGVNYSIWEQDFVPHSYKGVKLQARTSDLAAIRYRKKSGSLIDNKFDKEDLRSARIARRQVAISREEECNPFYIAKKTKGEIALAHPIRTAYIYAGRDESSFEDLKIELTKLFSDFCKQGGKIVEWEYIDEDNRHKLIQENKIQLREIVLDEVKKSGLNVVWGTDAHRVFPQDSENWSMENYSFFSERIPEWLKEKI